MGRTMKPKEVAPETAICNQNIVTGDNIDIRQFPAQRMWPLDGGLYLGTGDAVVTQCPETGRINVGTYRMMIKGPREIDGPPRQGRHARPREMVEARQADADRRRLRHRSAAFFGRGDELSKDPKANTNHYGGINGAPIELFKSDVTGLPAPAGAEIILEGFVRISTSCSPEGLSANSPADEGRLEPPGATPYMRVEKVRFRNNPTC